MCGRNQSVDMREKKMGEEPYLKMKVRKTGRGARRDREKGTTRKRPRSRRGDTEGRRDKSSLDRKIVGD